MNNKYVKKEVSIDYATKFNHFHIWAHEVTKRMHWLGTIDHFVIDGRQTLLQNLAIKDNKK
jgi:hypothetical protein